MIYLIRHGEAAATWGAHPDPGLSTNGQSQAETVAASLARLDLKQIRSSPMTRCQQTATAFADRSGLELVIEPNVTEIPTPSDVTDRVTWLRTLMAGEWSAAPTLVQDWRSRLLDTIAGLPSETAVFTHFVAINAIVGALEGQDSVTVFRPNYCSVTTLEPTPTGPHLIERGQSLETRVL